MIYLLIATCRHEAFEEKNGASLNTMLPMCVPTNSKSAGQCDWGNEWKCSGGNRRSGSKLSAVNPSNIPNGWKSTIQCRFGWGNPQTILTQAVFRQSGKRFNSRRNDRNGFGYSWLNEKSGFSKIFAAYGDSFHDFRCQSKPIHQIFPWNSFLVFSTVSSDFLTIF
jgi:hypothetical protein